MPNPKTKAQLQEEFRTSRPCRLCGKSLVKPEDTLGHTKTVCDAYKAQKAKEAALKAKKDASKPAKK